MRCPWRAQRRDARVSVGLRCTIASHRKGTNNEGGQIVYHRICTLTSSNCLCLVYDSLYLIPLSLVQGRP